MTTTVITTDIHARWDKARSVFEQTGMLKLGSDPWQDERQPGFRHIQNGDAVSLGYGETEANFLKWLFEVVGVDDAHLGNHELPAVYHTPENVMFTGWEWPEEVDSPFISEQLRLMGGGRDHEAVQYVRDLYAQGRYKVATAVGNWLITHAGLSPHLQASYRDATPGDIADSLNGRWQATMASGKHDPVIANTGEQNGGIMWVRPEGMLDRLEDDDSPSTQLNQIIGHTGHYGPKLYYDKLWIIDTPATSKKIPPTATRKRSNYGGVAALVTKDEGETWELFYEQ